MFTAKTKNNMFTAYITSTVFTVKITNKVKITTTTEITNVMFTVSAINKHSSYDSPSWHVALLFLLSIFGQPLTSPPKE